MPKKDNKGIALLLTVILASAILTIGVGVFNILYGQLIIVGKAEYSFQALYASDIGTEQTFYRDRQQGACTTGGCDMPLGAYSYPYGPDNNLCYHVDVDITPGCGGGVTTRCITVVGQYTCIPDVATATRFVRRAFELVY